MWNNLHHKTWAIRRTTNTISLPVLLHYCGNFRFSFRQNKLTSYLLLLRSVVNYWMIKQKNFSYNNSKYLIKSKYLLTDLLLLLRLSDILENIYILQISQISKKSFIWVEIVKNIKAKITAVMFIFTIIINRDKQRTEKLYWIWKTYLLLFLSVKNNVECLDCLIINNIFLLNA